MISGTVKDGQTGETLPGAHVYYTNDRGEIDTTTATTTDINGNFDISSGSGRALIISHIGYEPHQIPARQLTGSGHRTINLTPTATQLNQVEILAAAPVKNNWIIILAVAAAALILAHYLKK